MGITIEVNPTGTIKITSAPSAEGEIALLALAQPTVRGAAQNAGAFGGIAPAGTPSAEGAGVTQTAETIVQDATQNAGAFGGIAPAGAPSAVSPQSTSASNFAATESTPTPIIVDDFGSLPSVS